jgi:hypothetical protein
MNASLPPLPLSIGTMTDAQSAVVNQHYTKAMSTVERCLTCGGAKTFCWYDVANPASTEILTYDCPCIDQYRLSRWFWHSGVTIRYQRLGWRDLFRTEFVGFETYADYLANANAYVRAGLGLVLFGPRGTGKTLVGNLAVKDLISKGFDCYVTRFEDMVDAYREGWDDKASARQFDTRVRNAEVLMIDDLGRERMRGKWTVPEAMLESVVRHRVACEMPTIFTTNLDPTGKLEDAYGGHTISLLTECSVNCEVNGSDVRQDMYARARTEAQAGLTRPVVIG